jgi:putative ABC transport system permease protein
MWIQHRYFYEKAPSYWQGIVGWYVVRVQDPGAAVGVARAIDAEFANSASETRTQTESAFAASFMKQMGNIEFLIMAIGSVVFFTLLLVTGNTMAIAVRERTGELAVLKAVGYSDRFVLGFVLAESVLIAAVGGAIGLWLARGIAEQDITSGILPLYLSSSALAAGAAVALGTGLLAGLLPALAAMRLSVVDALRRI